MGARNHYDWEAAFQQWAGLGHARSYQKVADLLGTKKKTVMLAAHRLGWQARLEAIESAAAAEADSRRVRDRADRIQDTIRIIDASRSKFATQLLNSSFRLTGSDFVGLIKLEALLEGDPTGRVEISEVTSVLSTVFVIAGRYVPAEQRAQFMAELDEALGGLLDLGEAA